MQKFLVGCLIIVVIAGAGIAVAGYLFYRAASPLVQQAREYMTGLSTLSDLEAKVSNKATFTAPTSGELAAAQVERFARVQDAVRRSLGARVKEIEKKHESLKGNSQEQPSPTQVISAISDFIGLFIEARRYQMEALNAEKFSQSEYDWVRSRVYAAAGMQFTSSFDFRKLEELARAGQQQTGVAVPDLNLPEAPERNRELVKPYMDKMDEWLPLAFFGL